ncbi:cysteine hydrolase family protein [Propionivibrio limicola]|uniref:cysteine hydrolase family protein n=1 Tax=Propionivibrio limicola TaxID=167645 RepID=UPI0014786155|nr:isochorismatase family cysteine hydrolase [Propionivibrio limicola]
MASFATHNALLLVDFVNEIVDPNGKTSGKGYADFDARHGSLDRVSALLTQARKEDFAVIHVRIGFSADYKEQPEASPVFGGAKKFGALQLGTWGTEFHPKAAPTENETVITKHRVSPFYGTPLEAILRTFGVKNLFVAGVSTDMAVQAAIRDAHDRDFACHVIGDCCIAPNDDDHAHALRLLGKLSKIITLEEFLAEAHHSTPI